MHAPVSWLRELADVPADATGADIAAALVRVGLEEEGLHGEHASDHEGAGQVTAVQALLLEADPHERSGDVGAGRVRRDVRQLTQPGQGRVHQISIPNCWEKRTSPSTMSCMSATV